MGLAGNLSTMSLAEILQWLSIGQKTGTLQVKASNGTEKKVYFADGTVTSASSSDPRELIGQFLIASNKLTERQLKVALEMQARDQVMLGKVLLAQNILTKDELVGILKMASEEVIYDLFLWEEGAFEFLDGVQPEKNILSFNLDVTHLILSGVRRADEWQRIKAVFPDEQTVLRPNVEKIAENLPLHRNEERLLLLVDGKRNIEAIALEIRATRFKVFSGLLDLFEAELVCVGPAEDYLIPLPGAPEDPARKGIEAVQQMLNRGRLEEAESMIDKLEKTLPNDPRIKELSHACREKRFETTAKQLIRLDSIPELAMSVDAITKMSLTPEEGFIVSRINGIWDVQAIINIAPFDETLAFTTFKRFLDDGVITFKK